MSVELIANAIVAAITSGATAAASDTAKKAVGEAYSGLKALLVRKFGGESAPMRAVKDLEEDPHSKGYQMVVSEKLAKTSVASDPEIVSSAQSLLELLKALPQGGSFIQTAHGDGNALSGHGGTSTVTNNFGTNPLRGGGE